MGRVSVHEQFQINARYSAVEKLAEFNVQYNIALEFIWSWKISYDEAERLACLQKLAKIS